jgi:hypothetical protein
MADLLEELAAEERDRIVAARQPDWYPPMLARLTERRFSDPHWLFERSSTASVSWPSAIATGSGS